MGEAVKQEPEAQLRSAVWPDGLPEWAATRMRLDPYRLPARVGQELADGPSYTVDRQGAVMKRRLSCGLAVSIALPARSFRGVAARALVAADGRCTVTLELHHHDPALCVPLLVADDLDDIAADWHAWSRLLRLPMLIVEADESTHPLKAMLGAIMVEPPALRRRRSLLGRRPNFLRRRKAGVVGEVVRITGEELVARR